jgi:hypothetical protein
MMTGFHWAAAELARPTGPKLVPGFGDTPKHAINAGIAAIADLLRQQ